MHRKNVIMRISRRFPQVAIATLAVGSLTLAACSPSEQNDSDQSVSDQATSATSAASSAADNAMDDSDSAITFEDAYVTAKPADKEMTGIFGTLKNTSDKDIHITEVSGSAKGMYQLHVVSDGEMKEAEDGFTIKAGDSLVLQPGHEHIMLMDNTEDIAAGDVLSLTLKDDEGNSYELPDVPVRVQQSTHEHYSDGTTGDSSNSGAAESESMNHEGMDHEQHSN